MPNLVAIDVSVIDDRMRLVFSDRAVAAAYAAYLRAQDLRPPQYQTIPGYQRSPQLHTSSKEVTLSLPNFITWFITCRLPDDEDAVTFTFMDQHAALAARWADAMLLFEHVPQVASPPSTPGRHNHHSSHYYDDDEDDANENRHRSNSHSRPHPQSRSGSYLQHHQNPHSPTPIPAPAKQLHVRRLWNRSHMLKRLEELRRRTPTVRSRVNSPVWNSMIASGGLPRSPGSATSASGLGSTGSGYGFGSGNGNGYSSGNGNGYGVGNGYGSGMVNGGGNGYGGGYANGNGSGSGNGYGSSSGSPTHGGRTAVAVTGPGGVGQRGDIWW
ncbi:uncharacterized protein C8A04DRAFT_28289 [Dichotomopilus funicola]|uniref:Uncharacterized protein n=1 Tax=Dichotomopilus funicola TaxID=1934379 RepID=A0AAN6ZNW3_9PEZI|nr:hypothetical protein C8A04DRAFT_28289 [Dichotomopilus funicola]